MQDRIVWIGVRESDIAGIDFKFSDSITIFGSGLGRNQALERVLGRRLDYNDDCPEFDRFANERAEALITAYPQCRFMLYSPEDIGAFSKQVQVRCCNINSHDILIFLQNKIYTKMWIKDTVSVLPFAALLGAECSFKNLCQTFRGSTEFVVQAENSCGGYQTHFITSQNETSATADLSQHRIYAVSPYKRKGISVNLHMVIYRQQAVLFPGSVQIINSDCNILKYCGSDFIAYRHLSADIRGRIERAGTMIGKRLQSAGYRGVCGVDLLYADDRVYFMEINPRFQASTFLLNRSLTSDGYPSVQTYCFDAFNNSVCTYPTPSAISAESFYVYSYSDEQKDDLIWLHNRLKNSRDSSTCLDDALDWTFALEEHTYLFRGVFPYRIAFAHEEFGVRRHENTASASWHMDCEMDKDNLIRVKIALMNSGVRVSPEAERYIRQHGGADYKEFSALNILIESKVWISSPYGVKLTEHSPFCIEYNAARELILTFRDRRMFSVAVQADDEVSNRITSLGTPFYEIGYLNPDRLRIYHRYGCYYKDISAGCLFCDMPDPAPRFTEAEIEEVIAAYVNDPRINHYLIGGGSNNPSSDFSAIMKIASGIRRRTDKPITLMSLPTADKSILGDLQRAGITDVSFNIEVFDRNMAKAVMPGKGEIQLEYYLASLEAATGLWGTKGDVRSIVIVGLEGLETFSEGIRELCKIGASPALSLFRPPEDGPMSHWLPPRNDEVLAFYRCAEQICQSWKVPLGPSCPACENNIIKITI